jgi:hypothetical protein
MDVNQVNAQNVLKTTPNGKGRHVFETYKKLNPYLHFLSDPKERPWNKGIIDNLDELVNSVGAPEELALKRLVFAVKVSEKPNNLWTFVKGDLVDDWIRTGEYDVEFVGNVNTDEFDRNFEAFQRINQENCELASVIKKDRKGMRLTPKEREIKEKFLNKTSVSDRLPTKQEGVFEDPGQFEKTETLQQLEDLVTTKQKGRKGLEQ